MSLVREFHRAAGQSAPATPALRPDVGLVRLRMRLIAEEYKEVMDELAALTSPDAQDPQRHHEILRDLLKELADLRYVVEGCAVSLGLPFDEAYAEVHRSNMSKLPGGRRREDGKILKGPNYTPADMVRFVPDIIDIHEEDQHAADDS